MFYRLFSPYDSYLVNVRKNCFYCIFVLGRGIEPPRDCSHTPLKRTRLPVSPPEHNYVYLLYHLVFYLYKPSFKEIFICNSLSVFMCAEKFCFRADSSLIVFILILFFVFFCFVFFWLFLLLLFFFLLF